MSLQGKVALVTGGSRGIGAAIAEALRLQGVKVAATATSQEGADTLSERFKNSGGKGYKLDVRDKEAIYEVAKQIETDLGKIDILINNAGITRDALFMRSKDEDWEEVIAPNLSAAYHTSKAVMRNMIKARGGRIIFISSTVARLGNSGQANYGASKAGLQGLCRSLAREVGARNITVNCVAPGYVKTDMTQAVEPSYLEQVIKQIPLQRIGRPEEIAAAVTFLASDEASYITGQVLEVNGGIWMG